MLVTIFKLKEITLLQFFRLISSSRFCWFLLLVVAVALEACGLYFQYRLSLNPCIECVYERAYFLGFVLIGFIGALTANFWISRLICALAFVACSVGGFFTALSHYNAYTSNNMFGQSCKLQANFPDFLKLDEIAPWMFKPIGLCSDKLDWSFFGQSMPFWILFIFFVSIIVSVCMTVGLFVPHKAKNFKKLYR